MKTTARQLGLVTLVAVSAFVAGRHVPAAPTARATPPPATEHGSRATAVNPGADSPVRKIGRLPPPRPSASAADPSQDGAERAAHERIVANQLVSRVLAQVDYLARSNRSIDAETTANMMRPYMEGWVAAVAETMPGLLEAELPATVREALCDDRTRPGEIMTLAHLGKIVPGAITRDAVDCVSERPSEDVATWSVLDVWRESGMELTDSLRKLRDHATDERTRRRFLTSEEERSLRAKTASDPALAANGTPRTNSE